MKNVASEFRNSNLFGSSERKFELGGGIPGKIEREEKIDKWSDGETSNVMVNDGVKRRGSGSDDKI